MTRLRQVRDGYHPEDDVSNGLLVHVGPGNGDTDPTGRLVLLLDDRMDRLMPGGDLALSEVPDNDPERRQVQGQAQGLTMALWVVTCYSEAQVKQQMKIRWQQRQDKEDGNDAD